MALRLRPIRSLHVVCTVEPIDEAFIIAEAALQQLETPGIAWRNLMTASIRLLADTSAESNRAEHGSGS
jgi:hypothetical protein